MSSRGQIAGGVVGGVIGYFAGNVQLGAQLGMSIGSMIDPPDGPVINGPRLSDLTVQTSTYGEFIPRNYGTMAQRGNIIWLKGDKLTETAREESGGKGGSPSTANYWDYSATFALGLCEGPIGAVRRIWIGGQLWYDAGSGDLASIVASNEASDVFTLYKGTDTQLPDPLIQADRGVGNVPAYRGLAYIVFDNLPLAKYGNSLAGTQIKVEVMRAGSLLNAWSRWRTDSFTRPLAIHKMNTPYADDGAIYQWQIDTEVAYPLFSAFSIWRIDHVTGERTPYASTRAAIEGGLYTNGAFGPATIGYGDENALVVGGSTGGYNLTVVYSTGRTILVRPPYALTYPVYNYVLFETKLIYCGGNGNFGKDQRLFICDLYTGKHDVYQFPNYGGVIGPDSTFSIAVSSGKVFITSASSGVNYQMNVFDLETRTTLWMGDLSTFIGVGSNGSIFQWSGNIDDKYLYFTQDSQIWRVNSIDYTVGANLVASATMFSGSNVRRRFYGVGEGVVFGFNSYAGNTYDYADAYAKTGVSDSAAQLSYIVQTECVASGILSASDIDVTELTTSTLKGFRVSRLGAIRGSLETLRAAYPFDIIQRGYKIKFKKRGSASVATIKASELDARAVDSEFGIQITNTREMDTMLPHTLKVVYSDIAKEYDQNEQVAQRGSQS